MPGFEPGREAAAADLVVSGPLCAHEVTLLCARAEALLARRFGRDFVCTVSGDVDLGVVDLVAQLQLLALRLGVRLRVRAREIELHRLLALTGLQEAAGIELEPSEPGGQPETRE